MSWWPFPRAWTTRRPASSSPWPRRLPLCAWRTCAREAWSWWPAAAPSACSRPWPARSVGRASARSTRCPSGAPGPSGSAPPAPRRTSPASHPGRRMSPSTRLGRNPPGAARSPGSAPEARSPSSAWGRPRARCRSVTWCVGDCACAGCTPTGGTTSCRPCGSSTSTDQPGPGHQGADPHAGAAMSMPRQERALEVAAAAGAEALLATHVSTVTWLTGYAPPIETGPNPWAAAPLALLAGDGPPVVVVSEDEEAAARGLGCEVVNYTGYSLGPIETTQHAARALRMALDGRTRLATETGALPVALADGLTLVDVTDKLSLAR